MNRAAGVQLPGVLDDLFDATDRSLGITWAGPIPTVSVWAPTAMAVALLLGRGRRADRWSRRPRADVADVGRGVVGHR